MVLFVTFRGTIFNFFLNSRVDSNHFAKFATLKETILFFLVFVTLRETSKVEKTSPPLPLIGNFIQNTDILITLANIII